MTFMVKISVKNKAYIWVIRPPLSASVAVKCVIIVMTTAVLTHLKSTKMFEKEAKDVRKERVQ